MSNEQKNGMTDWRNNLNSFFEKPDTEETSRKRPEFDIFISEVVMPAFEDILKEMESHGRTVTIRSSGSSAAIIVHKGGEEEMTYRIQGRTFPNGVLPFAQIRFRERNGLKLLTVENMFRSGSPDYRLSDITREEIIQNFVENYTKRVQA